MILFMTTIDFESTNITSIFRCWFNKWNCGEDGTYVLIFEVVCYFFLNMFLNTILG